MKVCVTGSAGRLAAVLLPKLCAHSAVEKVRGVDLLGSAFTHPKFEQCRIGIADDGFELCDCDALVHLAFTLLRGRMSARRMHRCNVQSSMRLFEKACGARVARIVHLSSAAVYGHGTHLTETAALNPLPDFLYAAHKVELEKHLAQTLPQALVLRPHVILGPHAQPQLKQLLRMPFYLRLPDPQPQLQCVHEDDVAQAVILGLFSGVSGAVNLAAADTFSVRDVIRGHHPHAVGLAPRLAQGLLTAAWAISGWGGEPAWVTGITRGLTLNCDRAAARLNWIARYSSRQSVEHALAAVTKTN
ncbi:MAG: NAD-dependent epimerase/dehydratase family protein [Burkholderiales bacterium]